MATALKNRFASNSAPKLTTTEIMHLAKHTQLTPAQIESHFLMFLQENTDGGITKKKFRHLLGLCFHILDSDKIADNLFKMFGHESSDVITFNEFVTIIYILSSGTPEENLKLIFSRYDTDKDGQITKSELKKIVDDFQFLLTLDDQSIQAPFCNIKVGRRKVSHLMKEMDCDGDGKVTEKEFIIFVQRENLKLVFRLYDQNQDGTMSKDDLKKLAKDYYVLLEKGGEDYTKDEEKMTKEIIKEMDKNGDGVVTEEEFIDFVKKLNVVKIFIFKMLESCF